MKFKVGQKVRVRNFYDIAGTFDDCHSRHGLYFDKDMVDMCNQVYPISKISRWFSTDDDVVELNDTGYVFLEVWLEPVCEKHNVTLADVYDADAEFASFIANELCDEYNIIAIEVKDDLDLRNGEQYTAKYMCEIDLVLDPTHYSVDEDHTHAVLYKGEYLDAITTSFAKDIIKQRS